MSCCAHACYDAQFDDKHAAKDLDRFRNDGPDPTTRVLIDALLAADVRGATHLDIGGGVGAIHHELLAAGAVSATHVDASAPYLRAAQQEAERRGTAERVRFVHGDFVALAPGIAPADVVTLDRVICCYADMEALVEASASRARRLYGAVYPRERWMLRIAFALYNLYKLIMRDTFRAYLHSTDAIDAAVRRQGLTLRTERQTFVWRVVVYSR